MGTGVSARVETLLYAKSRTAPNMSTPKIKILAEFEKNVAKISASQAAKIGANYQPLLETLTWRP